MTKASKSSVMPMRRFPEFNGRALREVLFGSVTAESTIRNGERLPPTSVMGVTKAEGIVPMVKRIIASDITRYKVVKRDWFAYNPMRLNIGSIARWQGNSDIVVSPDYVVFQCSDDPDSGIDPVYLDHFRQSIAWENFVSERGDGGVRVRIYYKDLARLRLVLPPRAEQQKIADCLTSLDEVIFAQGQKLAALKTYKRGLTQQLFPREGETQPRRRFPEFRDAPEWETKLFFDLLEDVLDFRGRTPSKLGMEWGGGEIMSLSANNVKNGFINYNAECYFGSEDLYSRWMGDANLEKGDIVFTMEAPLGNALLVPDSRKYILSQRVVAFKTKPSVVNEFLIQLIWSDGFQNAVELLATGSTAKGISQKSLQGVSVLLPKEDEQRRIAQCLSPIDVQIIAESDKLDALRAHKRGLMQQLFPSPEEA